MIDDDGFTLVTGGKERNRKNRNVNKKRSESNIVCPSFNSVQITTVELKKKIDKEIEKLRSSTFFKRLEGILTEQPLISSVEDMVCYGIGKLDGLSTPRVQFALMILIREFLNNPVTHLFEPILSEVELKVIKCYGIELIDVNEEGSRKVSKMTLFFMPHCNAQLYENLLAANWTEGLKKVIILGNALSGYSLRCSRTKMKEFPCLEKAQENVCEKNFPEYESYEVFNDTAINWFK